MCFHSSKGGGRTVSQHIHTHSRSSMLNVMACLRSASKAWLHATYIKPQVAGRQGIQNNVSAKHTTHVMAYKTHVLLYREGR